jgi:hypothetical protein
MNLTQWAGPYQGQGSTSVNNSGYMAVPVCSEKVRIRPDPVWAAPASLARPQTPTLDAGAVRAVSGRGRRPGAAGGHGLASGMRFQEAGRSLLRRFVAAKEDEVTGASRWRMHGG